MKKLFKKERQMDDEMKTLSQMATDKRLSLKQKDKIRRVLEFNKDKLEEHVVVDDETAKKVEKWHEDRVRWGIREGIIKPPDPRDMPRK